MSPKGGHNFSGDRATSVLRHADIGLSEHDLRLLVGSGFLYKINQLEKVHSCYSMVTAGTPKPKTLKGCQERLGLPTLRSSYWFLVWNMGIFYIEP